MRERLPPGQAGHFLLLATVTGAGRTCDPSQPIRFNSGTLVLAAKLPGPSLLQFEDSLLRRRRLLRAGDTRLSPDFTEHLDLAEPEAQRSEAKWIPDLSHYEEGPWSQTDMGSNPVSSQTMRPLASYCSWRRAAQGRRHLPTWQVKKPRLMLTVTQPERAEPGCDLPSWPQLQGQHGESCHRAAHFEYLELLKGEFLLYKQGR